MSIFVLSATLTSAPNGAEAFLDAVAKDLETGVLCRLDSETAAYQADIRYGDGVIFANPESGRSISDAAQGLLERAEAVGAVVLPVAMTEDSREPPSVVSIRQSHDITDAARRRDIDPNVIAPLAHEFSRIALSRILPTLAVDQVRLFLCHRRHDGEELVAAVDKELSKRHSKFFRDLVNIQTGEVAQEKIDEALALADVLVFFDTPRAGESAWVALELATALGRGIPVLWIRVGTETQRTTLPVQPGGAPLIPSTDVPVGLTDERAIGDLADRILAETDVLNRANLRTAIATFARIKSRCRSQGRTVETLDARQQIYAITEPAETGPYPRRQTVHVVQIFARHPTDHDQQQLTDWLAANDYGPHEVNCRAFDAAVLLDPLPGAPLSFGGFGVSEPATDYLGRLQEVTALARDDHHEGTLLLLGAFPSAVVTHQGVIEAVQAVTRTWLELGGSVVCGGHPTFVPLLTEAIRSVGADREQLVVYWSRYFATTEAIDALLTQAQVIAIDEVGGARDQSLTAIREAMMAHSNRAAVVAIGGRTSELGTHVPGLDEEVRLARRNELPVYLIGAPGGQTAHLIRDATESGWTQLGNPLSANDNLLLAESEQYEEISRLIWSGHR